MISVSVLDSNSKPLESYPSQKNNVEWVNNRTNKKNTDEEAPYQESLEISIVGNDAVVDDDEFTRGIRALGVGVDIRGRSMSGPPGVGNPHMAREVLRPIELELYHGGEGKSTFDC